MPDDKAKGFLTLCNLKGCGGLFQSPPPYIIGLNHGKLNKLRFIGEVGGKEKLLQHCEIGDAIMSSQYM